MAEEKQASTLQLIWGMLLVLAGVGVVFRIPEVIPKLKQYEYFADFIFFAYFCSYIMALILVVGGLRKIYAYYKNKNVE
jgi:cobalamin biosynthesis protein CobD/CbiB